MPGTSGILFRAFLIWLIIIAAETMNGVVREMLISPIVGGQTGRQISFSVAILLISVITLALVRWLGAVDNRRLLGVGLFWAVLTFIFELEMSLTVGGRSWAETLADFDPSLDGLMAFGLVFLMAVPLLAFSVLKMIRSGVGSSVESSDSAKERP